MFFVVSQLDEWNLKQHEKRCWKAEALTLRLVIRSLLLSFLRPHFLLQIKIAAIWPEHVIPAELAPGRLNEFYFRSLNIIYIGKFKEIC